MLTVKELCVPSEVIQKLHSSKHVQVDVDYIPPINSYFVFRSSLNPKSTAIAKHNGNKVFTKVTTSWSDRISINPKDVCQTSFLDSLMDPNVLLNVGIGAAGTGKTTMALAFATWNYLENQKPILMSKPTSMVGKGRAFGPVPGDVQDKYAPYLSSYKIVLKKMFGSNSSSYLDRMQQRGHIEYVPIELARGCTYEDCTFILDEVQNLDWHELNTIVSRMGEGTTLIMLGDPFQIDTKMTRAETGISKLLNSKAFQRSSLTSAIELKNQYRSPICALVAEVDKEIRNGRKQSSSTENTERTVATAA